MRIIGKYVGSVLLSIPFALMITWGVEILTIQSNDRIDWLREYERWIGLVAFFASLIVCTLWVLRTDNRHLAISRGCGVFAVAVFAILGVALVNLILEPTPQNPILPQFSAVAFVAVIGISVGTIAGIIAWDYTEGGGGPLGASTPQLKGERHGYLSN